MRKACADLLLGEADTRAKLIDPTLHLPVFGFKPKSIFRGGDRHIGYIADICNQESALICWRYQWVWDCSNPYDIQLASQVLRFNLCNGIVKNNGMTGSEG